MKTYTIDLRETPLVERNHKKYLPLTKEIKELFIKQKEPSNPITITGFDDKNNVTFVMLRRYAGTFLILHNHRTSISPSLRNEWTVSFACTVDNLMDFQTGDPIPYWWDMATVKLAITDLTDPTDEISGLIF